MKFKDLKIGQHVWLKESDCCGANHEAGEEGIITHIDKDNCFQVETIKRKVSFWHELKCITIRPKEHLDDELFEI